MKWIGLLFCALSVALFCGCNSIDDELTTTTMTLDDLEGRMQKAADPSGRAVKAKTSILRLEVTTPHWLDPATVQMVETKFEQPGKFNLTTYEDNEPVMATIIDGKNGWMVDFAGRKVRALDREFLDLASTMAHISNPSSKLRNIFSRVDIKMCSNDDGDFYRLACYRGDRNPVYIYVDRNDFLVKRLKANFKLGRGSISYDSKINRYGLYEGIRVPVETEVRSAGELQQSKLMYYNLDTPIPPTDFMPPVF